MPPRILASGPKPCGGNNSQQRKCRKIFLEAIFLSFEASAQTFHHILRDIIVLENFLLIVFQSIMI